MQTSRFLVNGEWRTSAVKRPVINPYEGRSVGEVYQASPEDIDAAVSAAARSFNRSRRLSSRERSETLRRVSDEVGRRKEELARLITLETGKPISFSRVEVDRCVLTFRVASEEAGRIEGTVLPLDLAPNSEGRTALVRRFPLGPISAITPFNFPLNLVAHKLGPAIASGNTVVLKPSSNGPLTSLELGKIVEAADAMDTLLTAVRELKLGNRYFEKVFDASVELAKKHEKFKFVRLFLEKALAYREDLTGPKAEDI